MKIWISVLAICTAATIALGQGDQSKAITWMTYTPTDQTFSVDVPFQLALRGDPKGTLAQKYFGSGPGVYLYIFSDPARRPGEGATASSFIESQGQHLSFEPMPGRPIHFEDEFGYWHTVVAASTGSRAFIVQAISADKQNKLAEKFVSSFRLKEQAAAVPPAPEQSADLPTGSLVPEVPTGSGSGSGAGRGDGTGQGSGFGNANGTGTGALPPRTGTAGILLLSKPRPSYTNLARVYEISGTIIVRITFQEDSKVGAISVVKSLPCGLDGRAVSAAGRITFQPAIKDGVPYAVTKQVEYTFSIY